MVKKQLVPYIRNFSNKSMTYGLSQEEIRALSLRNLRTISKDWEESEREDCANLAYLDGRIIIPKHLAFHIARGNQNILTASRRDYRNSELSMKHVFFCTDKEDLEFYLGLSIDDFLKSDSTEMVYFADLNRVTQARVQTAYKSPVIFQDDIERKEQEYAKGRASAAEVAGAYGDWLTKYTKTHNPNRLVRMLSNKRGHYVLLREPIRVMRS